MILRNLLIREPRLPFNPTGRHCLNGRSTRKGEKGTSWPGRVGLELGTLPNWHSPLSLTGLPRSTWTSHTDCLNAPTAYLGPQKPTFHSPIWELGMGSFSGNSQRQEGAARENSETRQIPVCLETRSLLVSPPPPPRGEVPCHLRAHSQPGLLPKPHTLFLSPKSLCARSDSIQWEKLRRVATSWLRLRLDSRWMARRTPPLSSWLERPSTGPVRLKDGQSSGGVPCAPQFFHAKNRDSAAVGGSCVQFGVPSGPCP